MQRVLEAPPTPGVRLGGDFTAVTCILEGTTVADGRSRTTRYHRIVRFRLDMDYIHVQFNRTLCCEHSRRIRPKGIRNELPFLNDEFSMPTNVRDEFAISFSFTLNSFHSDELSCLFMNSNKRVFIKTIIIFQRIRYE